MNEKTRAERNRERKEKFWDVKLKGDVEMQEGEDMEDDPLAHKMTPDLNRVKNEILCNPQNVQNISTYSSSIFGSLGIDNSFSLRDFKKNLQIKILSMAPPEEKESRMVFDMIGVEAPVANALRRIMLAEIPTMAIETVFFHDNSSIIPDELLAHRLGLIPIYADAENFQYQKNKDEPNSNDTLVFVLDVRCFRKENGEIENHLVRSGQLIWKPAGEQKDKFLEPPRPVHDDIVIAKLKPGQRIHVECHAVKGIGKEHAKWSPVCTAFYRLKPKVEILEEISGEQAKNLVKVCPMGVFDIEDTRAHVARQQNCTVCRECIRAKDWEKKIRLSRVKNHFTFSIESTGILHPKEIFRRAIQILQEKATSIINETTEYENRED